MRKLSIACAGSHNAKKWKNESITYESLKEKLRTPLRTPETVSEYKGMSKQDRSRAKDHGGFVAGYLKDGIRRSDTVASRSMIVLDADRAAPETIENFEKIMPYTSCLHTTHSSTREKSKAADPLSKKGIVGAFNNAYFPI